MNNFSPNMLKTFENCPKKFDYKYNARISLPQNPDFFEKGKKIHALASYYLQGADVTKLENVFSAEEKTLWERLKSNEFFCKTCLHTEFSVTSKIGEYWISGRLDALMKEDENYYILDYKTGSIPQNPEKDFQTMIYLLCADKLIQNYDTLKFVYIDLKNNKNHIIEFSGAEKKNYENILLLKCKEIADINNYENKTNMNHCKFCEYNKICLI